MRLPLVVFAAACCCWQPLLAAPLDELLTMVHPTREVEVGYDLVNSTVDVFKIRDKDPIAAGTALGDYSGFHLAAGTPLFDRRAWLEGALWQRKLNIANLGAGDAHIQSWSLAGQYQIARQLGALPDLALRLGVWGDSAGAITKQSPTAFNEFTVGRLEVVNPRDRQVQGDVVASWSSAGRASFNLFAGVTSSSVDFDNVRAFEGRCAYIVSSPSAKQVLMNTDSSGCDPVLIQNRVAFAPRYNINSLRYHASSSHFGASSMAVEGRWRLRAGIRWEKIRRGLDDDIAAAGGTTVSGNSILTGEIGYRVAERVGLVVRGHYFTRQLNGELPFTYNALTAEKFNHRYGLLTTALVFAFD